jgi:hypothetical protein
MEDLSNYKIIVDYASQEVKKFEGSKISDPTRYEKAVNRLKIAKIELVRAMNKFAYDNFAIGLKFPEED